MHATLPAAVVRVVVSACFSAKINWKTINESVSFAGKSPRGV